MNAIFSRDRMPTFIETSPSPSVFDAPPDRDRARTWAIFGQRLLRLDPFELDRWADDGGPAVDHW